MPPTCTSRRGKMMRTVVWAWAAAAGIAATVTAGRADEPAAAKDLIDRALKAAGGAEKLKQPRGYTFKVTTTTRDGGTPEVKTVSSHYFLPPRRFRFEEEYQRDGQPQKSVWVINGAKG